MFRRCAVIAGKMMQTTTEDHQLIARSTAWSANIRPAQL